METYFYLSMTPESLVASLLAPSAFGTYLAVGTRKRSRGEALFFDLKADFESDCFDLAGARARCVPHPGGEPKHSVYAAIYRVLEHVPLEAIHSLWLATAEGRVLELKSARAPAEFPGKYFLYQQICPVHPLIVSSLSPDAFCRFITDTSRPISVPRICFTDLDLGGLAEDPARGEDEASDLPYGRIEHLRDCLQQIAAQPEKHTKTVDRSHPQQFPYRCVKNGFYVGDQQGMLYYPFPSREEMERKHLRWWRSASQ